MSTHGFYVPTAAPSYLVEQRILEQAARLPDGGAVTGWAACRWWGARFFDGLRTDGQTPIPVPLAIGRHGKVRPDRFVCVSHERLETDEIVTKGGVRITSRERATFDEMRRTGDVREAVQTMDMMAAAEQTSIVRMRRYAERHRGWSRIGLVRDALDLASEHSWSPNETRLRLIWVLDCLLARPLVNCSILDREGHLLGVVDLLDEEAGLVVEYDGADHRGAIRHSKDVAKEERLRRVGLEVARVTGPDLRDRALVVRRLHEARGRARFEAPAGRAWIARPRKDVLEETLCEREWREGLMQQPKPDIRKLRGW